MQYLKCALPLVVVAAAIVGCNGGSESVTPPEVSARDAVKAQLEQLAESGEGGSGIGAIMEHLKTLSETDPALADELSKDATAMMEGGSMDEIKAKAKEMLAKLEGGAGEGESSE